MEEEIFERMGGKKKDTVAYNAYWISASIMN